MMLTEQQMRERIDALPLDELVGQVLNFDLSEKRHSMEDLEEWLRRSKPGSLYIHGHNSAEFTKKVHELQDRICPTPTMYVADVENGPDYAVQAEVPNCTTVPHPMAWGAVDDPDLVERVNEATARVCRKNNVHLALAPVVDINMNFNNSLVNTRAISDDTDTVIRNARAMVRGFQKNRMMAACCKHFPGDGVDQRDQHLQTTINSLSKEEWMNTYGRVYRAMIEEGTLSIMVAHIALPAFDEKINDDLGYPPATLSKNLMTNLLKGELGFQGCIVSDAMCMIGVCAMTDIDNMAVEYLKAGGDLLLFALPSDFDRIKEALESGELSLERLKDAVLRIWRMKNALGLFGEDAEVQAELANNPTEEIATISQEIADRSVTVIRNSLGVFPQTDLKPGAKVLQVVVGPTKPDDESKYTFPVLQEELRARGCEVTTYYNCLHYPFKNVTEEYDLVLYNIYVDIFTYSGGTLRSGNVQMLPLWRGYLLRHPKVIFTSFGDPYKLYDYPFARTYVNMYSPCEYSQRAFVKALFGEIPTEGRSPVRLEGFFERGAGL